MTAGVALSLVGLVTAVLVVVLAVRVRQLRGAIRQTSPVVLTEARVRDIVAVAALADVLRRHRIALAAETAVDNAAGRRLLEHAGMEQVAERTRRLLDGREVASVVYQRTSG